MQKKFLFSEKKDPKCDIHDATAQGSLTPKTPPPPPPPPPQTPKEKNQQSKEDGSSSPYEWISRGEGGGQNFSVFAYLQKWLSHEGRGVKDADARKVNHARLLWRELSEYKLAITQGVAAQWVSHTEEEGKYKTAKR